MKTLLMSLPIILGSWMALDGYADSGGMLISIGLLLFAVRGVARWIERMIRVSRGEG